ncbi:MAG: hypothetical protein HS101_15480 [Planctomycetia bacterium]|nr:hypothetical protein [Planctomycetia bacterium]
MEAYSMDLRKRVLAACDAGHGTTRVAKSFEVSPAWVRRLKQRRRELGTIARCRIGPDRSRSSTTLESAAPQAGGDPARCDPGRTARPAGSGGHPGPPLPHAPQDEAVAKKVALCG